MKRDTREGIFNSRFESPVDGSGVRRGVCERRDRRGEPPRL